ncbi:hypothetical protein K466DRAFT_596737 [Polyporus arcularius HHB13444]|uniref:Uncharacterized protein n=1 Tax=Polyporus arcularius HHB13444 TaxID=1314778 RepID=A0A5C3PNU5_9APHY|nr:hypothetical protein K466DRAFT_596737 [Polyporus arcularius HHB13444]
MQVPTPVILLLILLCEADLILARFLDIRAVGSNRDATASLSDSLARAVALDTAPSYQQSLPRGVVGSNRDRDSSSDRRAKSATDSTMSKYVAASMDNTPDLHHPTVLEGAGYQGESREWLLIRVVGAELAVMGAAFVGVALDSLPPTYYPRPLMSPMGGGDGYALKALLVDLQDECWT